MAEGELCTQPPQCLTDWPQMLILMFMHVGPGHWVLHTRSSTCPAACHPHAHQTPHLRAQDVPCHTAHALAELAQELRSALHSSDLQMQVWDGFWWVWWRMS